MLNLQELQAAFKQHLFNQESDIGTHIVGTERVNSETRLGLYSYAYRARLVEALESDYPVLCHVLGEDRFTHLCHEYTHAYPSTYFTLRWFGQHLGGFLKKHPDYKNDNYLFELAEFEWSFTKAFDAPDTSTIGEEDLASVPPDAWPALKVGFHPSVQLVQHNWNVVALWRAVKDEVSLPKLEKLPQVDNYLIWRNDLKTQYRFLEPDEAATLYVVSVGGSFVAICEALTSFNEDQSQIPLRAVSLLKAWLAAGLLSTFSL